MNKRLTLVEGAFRSKLTYGQLYSLVLRGQVRGERVGHRWLVDAGDVQRLRREQLAASGVREDGS